MSDSEEEYDYNSDDQPLSEEYSTSDSDDEESDLSTNEELTRKQTNIIGNDFSDEKQEDSESEDSSSEYESDEEIIHETKFGKLNYKEMRLNDSLCERTRSEPDVIEFLLKLAKFAAESSRADIIYKPAFPELNEDLLKKDPKQLVKQIKKCYEDRKLPFDYLTYRYIMFTLNSAPISFKKVNLFSVEGSEQFKVESNPYERRRAFNEHKLKNGGKTCYLYHGSVIENWYSLLINGVFVASGTEHQANGAVYGPGVYLSNSVEFSLSYSGHRAWKPLPSGTPTTKIVGVYEVAGTREKYKKTTNIFVVPDKNMLLLRYFLIYDDNNMISISNKINNYFGGKIHTDNRTESEKSRRRAERRILNESDLIGDKINFKNGSIFCWKILIGYERYDKDCLLRKDMIEQGIENIELEIEFGDNYPFEAPFFRIIQPIFKYKTGHVTIGGALCTNLITKSGWSPVLGISEIIQNIISLTGKNGRIDPTKKGQTYSYHDAVTAHERVTSRYGWNK